jgi:hypothetical protein
MKSPKLGVISTFEWTETMDAPHSTRIYIPLNIAKKIKKFAKTEVEYLTCSSVVSSSLSQSHRRQLVNTYRDRLERICKIQCTLSIAYAIADYHSTSS